MVALRCGGIIAVMSQFGADDAAAVRRADNADAEKVVQLVRSAYRGEASRTGWTSEADLVEGERIDLDQVHTMIADPKSVLLVLPDAEGLLACAQVVDLGDGLSYFGTFAVRPQRQGGGVGRQVMAAAERWARSTFAAHAMEMTVLTQQDNLISWYERLGFCRTGETRTFPADEKFARPRRGDLTFAVLSKDLRSGQQNADGDA